MSLNVPFSWEHEPGISKVTVSPLQKNGGSGVICLPPPPCTAANNFQRVSSKKTGRYSSRKVEDHEDPFLLAYLECKKDSQTLFGGIDDGFGLGKKKKMEKKKEKKMFGFNTACKQLCAGDDSIVKLSELPVSRSKGKTLKFLIP